MVYVYLYTYIICLLLFACVHILIYMYIWWDNRGLHYRYQWWIDPEICHHYVTACCVDLSESIICPWYQHGSSSKRCLVINLHWCLERHGLGWNLMRLNHSHSLLPETPTIQSFSLDASTRMWWIPGPSPTAMAVVDPVSPSSIIVTTKCWDPKSPEQNQGLKMVEGYYNMRGQGLSSIPEPLFLSTGSWPKTLFPIMMFSVPQNSEWFFIIF